ncbi:uncharacterized protein [Procambarus clarkii]|uniref:uncharacterized protein isoform X2 n=1 Tax=Procambarus clarkii TaxID=6728 RepID=UPI0037444FCC
MHNMLFSTLLRKIRLLQRKIQYPAAHSRREDQIHESCSGKFDSNYVNFQDIIKRFGPQCCQNVVVFFVIFRKYSIFHRIFGYHGPLEEFVGVLSEADIPLLPPTLESLDLYLTLQQLPVLIRHLSHLPHLQYLDIDLDATGYVDPDTLDAMSYGDPDTLDATGYVDPDTLDAMSYGDPDTLDATGYVDPDTLDAMSYGDPDTLDAMSYGDPDTLDAMSYGDPDTLDATGYVDPDTLDAMSYGDPDTLDAMSYGDPDTLDAMSYGDPDTLDATG